jgi:hypothetical protein
MRNFVSKYLIQTALSLIFIISCTDQNLTKGDGVLKGKISIGPICPVETIPPDPRCLPTAETYRAWATAVWTLNRKVKVASLNPNLDGKYEINLPSGSYIIDFDQSNHFGSSNLPSIVTISLGDTTKLNINIDTGIR